MRELQEAIENLKNNYEYAKRNDSYIRHPIEWALYKTWADAEKERIKKHQADKEVEDGTEID